MTFEELLKYPDTIDKLTDDQLVDLLRPFFPLTRPLKTIKLDTEIVGMDPEIAAKLEAIKARPSLLNRLKQS